MIKVLSFRLQQCFDPFAMLCVKGPLKHDFLDIYLNMFFGASSPRNRPAISVIFSWKVFKP